MNYTYLMATVTHGIEYVDYDDYPDVDWEIDLDCFIDRLGRLKDDEVVFFIANPYKLAAIQNDYAITY